MNIQFGSGVSFAAKQPRFYIGSDGVRYDRTTGKPAPLMGGTGNHVAPPRKPKESRPAPQVSKREPQAPVRVIDRFDLEAEQEGGAARQLVKDTRRAG